MHSVTSSEEGYGEGTKKENNLQRKEMSVKPFFRLEMSISDFPEEVFRIMIKAKYDKSEEGQGGIQRFCGKGCVSEDTTFLF